MYVLLLLFFACLPALAQPGYDPALKPFYHGVASGDPLSDRVIIWTRVEPGTPGSTVLVSWKVATDPALSNVVQSGTFVTDAARDYTVKVDVMDLLPGRTYYYQFNALGQNSLTGRTKTAPVGEVDNLKFAVVSCNNFEGGYFNAFGRIADRNDLDAVIHLGDYIYEQAEGRYFNPAIAGQRPVQPKGEIVSLDDYRLRYSTYRLDENLRRAHQQHAFIPVWDDHESANDAFKDGAENHDPATQGPWEDRKNVSRQVYEEWMPIRSAMPLYRVKPYGNLVDLIMIDTRIEGRDEQINDVTNPALYAPDRTILGVEQREWLFEQLKNSTAKWKVIGNQVIFSDFNVWFAASPQLGTPQQLESIFLDIWDGYPAERQKVIDFIAGNKIDNVVILTGDFHSSFAFDVAARPAFTPLNPTQQPNYDPQTGAGSVAVEFATPSISSANFDENVDPQTAAGFQFQINRPLPAQAGPLAGINPNPHMKYVDLIRHGYFVLNLTREKAQADWYFVDTILAPSDQESFDAGFYTLDGQNRLQQADQQSPAKPAEQMPAPAPARPAAGGLAGSLDVELLGTYASCLFGQSAAEIPAYDPQTKRLFVVNALGTVDVLNLADPANPVKLFTINVQELTGGTPNSVDIKNGIAAIAIEVQDADGTQLPGKVAFLATDIADVPTELPHTVTVGSLPDMLTFTPDGTKVLVANEGEPSAVADPPGSVSIIDISGGIANAQVTTLGFEAFDGKEAELRSRGVRLFPGKKVSEDVEPEYIALSPDGKTALVTLQEANALAVLDIDNARFLDILPLGYKDHRRGQPGLQTYAFNEPPIGKTLAGDDILFGGLSGLFFEKEEGGKLIFVTVPDRGPNGEEAPQGRQFLKPDYVAEIIRFALDPLNGTITILNKIPLVRRDGDQIKPITGFPNIPGVDEKPIDEAGNELPYDPYGADLEGIVIAPDGTYWMVDEYRPAIYQFNAEGMLLHRYIPKGTAALGGQPEGYYGEETLPAEYATRRSNRGFEGMALDTDKGILYAFIQTPLRNPNAAASNNSSVIRMLGIDPASGQPVAEYVYLLEKPKVGTSLVDKIGDAAYDARTGRFYVMERDSDLTPTAQKFVYEVDLIGATNLLAPGAPALLAGKTLEQHTADDLAAAGIKPVFKLKILNLPSIGYLPSDKPEGLTILPDGSLAVINDNDFGLAGADEVALGIITFGEGNRLDASDRDGKINIRNWPVLGMYMPDAIASFEVDGQTFYVTANEGDARSEDARAGANSVVLNPLVFPDAETLKLPGNLGRLDISTIDGDLTGDGTYERLYAYGARSFSVWDQYGNLVYDSSDDFEKITAEIFPDFFNASNADNTFDSRSDNKGPEPEGVVVGRINGRPYAFVGLERIGGFMVYDLSNPQTPQFVNYTNNRDFTAAIDSPEAGDLGPEGLVFIDAADSPTNTPLLVVSNEVSGTTSIYGIIRKPAVLNYTLVNAETNTDIGPLTDGGVIDFARLPTTKLNIRANTEPDEVGSVIFELNGAVFSTENLPFYTLAGDLDGNYREWTPAAGDYVLKATPYTAARGEGIAGTPLSISFSVINSATVASFTLVDARRGEDIREIKDGDVINLKSLPGKQLNIRANTAPESVGSVVFGLNDRPVQQTENILPYALFGNRGRDFQDYNPWTPRPGSYTITATPYSERNGQGARGIASTITIQIVDEPEVSRLVLYDATSGQDIAELTDNMVLNLSELGITPEMNLNVRAETHPDRVGSVVFAFRGNTRFAVENILPYDLFGDPGSRGARFAFTAGTYTLTATPYASRNGTGKAGIARTVQFTVDDSPAASAVARTASPEMAGRENAAEVPAVRIFPNPTSGKLVVEFTAALRGEVSLRVYDVMGRKTYLEEERHLNGEQSIEVDITSLPARFYILRVQAAGIDQSIKILKQ